MLMLFILGAVLASFLNVGVNEEFAASRWLSSGRSHCDSCRRTLRWWELIPVLSWCALAGRCPRCRKLISVLHPASEMALGTAYAFGMVFSPDNAVYLFLYLLCVTLLYLFAMYDIMHRIVPDKLVFIGIAVWVVLLIIPQVREFPAEMTLISRIIGSLSLAGVFCFINVLTTQGLFLGIPKGKQGFGWGDAKLSLLLGIILGWPLVNVVFWGAVLLGAVYGLLLYLKVRKRYVQIPFVPFLTIGSWVALLWGDAIMEWFMRSLFLT